MVSHWAWCSGPPRSCPFPSSTVLASVLSQPLSRGQCFLWGKSQPARSLAPPGSLPHELGVPGEVPQFAHVLCHLVALVEAHGEGVARATAAALPRLTQRKPFCCLLEVGFCCAVRAGLRLTVTHLLQPSLPSSEGNLAVSAPTTLGISSAFPIQPRSSSQHCPPATQIPNTGLTETAQINLNSQVESGCFQLGICRVCPRSSMYALYFSQGSVCSVAPECLGCKVGQARQHKG